MPDNIQALLAARLDTLTPERKSLLQDAAVVGKVFWSGAVAAIGAGDDGLVRNQLHELVRKELVRPARTSSMQGQQEYSFWHALVRDVCYSQIPRAARARKHERMAAWMQEMAGDRVADHAEVLAHHYSEALALASASGAQEERERLLAPTIRFTTLAGDRAAGLDAPRAVAYYEAALALMPPHDPARGQTLLSAGEVAEDVGDPPKAETYLREAIDLLSVSDAAKQAKAMRTLATLIANQGKLEEWRRLRDDARVLLERHGRPSPELVRTYCGLASSHSFGGAAREGLMWANKAISLARDLGEEGLEAVALNTRGDARCQLGDSGGVADMRIGALRSEELNASPRDLFSNFVNLGDAAWLFEGPGEGLEAKRHALDLGSRRGMMLLAMWAKAESLAMLFDLGQWDQLLSEADEVLAWTTSQQAYSVEARALSYKCAVLSHRGQLKEALAGAERLDDVVRHGVDERGTLPALAMSASILMAAGDEAAAVERITRFAGSTGALTWRALFLPRVIRVLTTAGELDMARDLLVDDTDVEAIRDKNSVLTAKAILLEAQGQMEQGRNLYQEASQRWADYGFVLEEGEALLGLARCLIALGDREAAGEPLQKARAIFSRLGAVPLIKETDSYLQAEAAS